MQGLKVGVLDVGFKCFDPLEEVWIFDLPLDCVTVLGVELMMRLCLSLSSVSVWVPPPPIFPSVRDLSGSFGVSSRGHCSFPSCRLGVSYGKR